MLGDVWNRLFDLEEKAKASNQMAKYEILREVEDELQAAYDKTCTVEYRDSRREPKNDWEKLATKTPDIIPYKDPTDEQEYYLFDGYRYPNAEKAVEQVVIAREYLKRNYESLLVKYEKAKDRISEQEKEIRHLTKKLKELEKGDNNV